jgi:membrane protein DedA with SNARE-associated domain
MEHLLIKYGYLVLFLGVAVEGEGFLLVASFMAHRGYLYLPVVMLVALAAKCAADQIYYLVARARGRAWLEGRFGNHPRYQRTVSPMSPYANWLLLFSRFAVGFRIIIPAACGALGMSPVRFSIINFFAGLIWTVPTALLGFYFGQVAEPVLASARHYEWSLLLLFLLAVVAILVARHWRRAEWVRT